MNPKQSIIWLVEDNPDHAELTRTCLLQHIAVTEVIHLRDGYEAAGLVQRAASREAAEQTALPNLILLDLRLPKVSGMDVLRSVRQSTQLAKTPVVILTSSEADRDIVDAYQLGANGYTVKPLDFEKLQQLVADICTFWLVWNHVPKATALINVGV